MNIYLVRHADYEKTSGFLKGRLPVALSSEGIKQSENLKEFFEDKKIDMIFSSAVKRCKQTAEIISNNKIPIEFDKRLLEALIPYQGYKDGSWSSDAYTHQEELGGETIIDVQDRMIDFYKEIITKNYQNIIVCSHGDPLQFLYIHLISGSIPQDYAKLRNQYPEYQSKASVRLVEVKNKEIQKMEMILEQEELND